MRRPVHPTAACTFLSLLMCGCVASSRSNAGEPTQKPPTKLDVEVYKTPSFSRDGSYLALIAMTKNPDLKWSTRVYNTIIWETEILSKELFLKHGHCTNFRWAPLRDMFAYEIMDQDLHFSEWRIGQLSTDEPECIREWPNCTGFAQWSQSGRYFAFSDAWWEVQKIYRYDLVTRKAESISFKRPCIAKAFDWADDGESIWLASGDFERKEVSEDDGVFRVYFDQRPSKKLCSIPRLLSITSSPDFRWIACEIAQEAMIEGVRPNLAVVEVATGKVRDLGLIDLQTEPVWRHDSKYLAYSDESEIRIYDPVSEKNKESIRIGCCGSQPFWHPKDHSLWVTKWRGPEILRFNGSEWKLVFTVNP